MVFCDPAGSTITPENQSTSWGPRVFGFRPPAGGWKKVYEFSKNSSSFAAIDIVCLGMDEIATKLAAKNKTKFIMPI